MSITFKSVHYIRTPEVVWGDDPDILQYGKVDILWDLLVVEWYGFIANVRYGGTADAGVADDSSPNRRVGSNPTIGSDGYSATCLGPTLRR